MEDSMADLENRNTRSVRLLSKDRVLMFLNEYYLSRSKALTLMRIFSGPLMIYIGVNFLTTYHDRAFAYFSILYGCYLIIKPLVWILFRLNSFKTEAVEIDVQEDFILIKDRFSENRILFDGFEEIFKKHWYYVLQVNKANQIHLPFYLFTRSQCEILDQNLTR